jgi:tetratricopeptide (TPR) repeat protein
LAHLLADMGELDEALSLYERALLIREKILDPKNPVMIQNISSLAELLNKMGRAGEVESLLQRKSSHHYSSRDHGNPIE